MDLSKMAEISKSDIVAILWRIVGVIAMAAGGWAFTILIGVQTDVRVMQNQINYFMADRYRADEARRDFQLRDQMLSMLETRISHLEAALNKTDIRIEQAAPVLRRKAQ